MGDDIRITEGYWIGKHATVIAPSDVRSSKEYVVVRTEDGEEGLVMSDGWAPADQREFSSARGRQRAGRSARYPCRSRQRGWPSLLKPAVLRGYGEAIRDGVARHPELLNRKGGLKGVSFLSADHDLQGNEMVVNAVLVTMSSEHTIVGSQIVLNDLRDFPTSPSFRAAMAPSTVEPRGTMTHEIGHAFAHAHGFVGHDDALHALFMKYDIAPRDVAPISEYGASDISEAFAELYGMTYTPGFAIPDSVLRTKFNRLLADMQTHPYSRTGVPQPVVSDDPELLAEVKRAAAENVAANAWAAATPLLDALRATLSGERPKP